MSEERNTDNLENNVPGISLEENDGVRVDSADELVLPSLSETAELEKDVFGGDEIQPATSADVEESAQTDCEDYPENVQEPEECEDGQDMIEADFEDINEASSEVAVVETVAAEEPEKKKKGIIGKIFKGIGILLALLFFAAVGFVGYKVWLYLQVYVYPQVHPVPATFSNETVSLSIDSVEFIDEIVGFELDENYVYLGVKYTVTNNSEQAVQWKAFPLLSVNEYIPSDDEKKPGHVLVEETSQAYELNGLRNYGIHQEIDFRNAKDDLAPGEARVSADIFKISRSDYSSKEYFLTTDIFNEIVDLPDLEATDVVTDDTTVTE